MLRSLLCAGAVLAFVSSASAADLGGFDYGDSGYHVPLSLSANYQVPARWIGFYVGANGGMGRGTYQQDNTGAVGDISQKGWIFGGQAGYNYQLGSWVLGVETDFQLSHIGGSQSVDLCPGCGPFSVVETQDVSMPWFGTLRGRVGYAIMPQLLLYGTGGLAYGKVKTTDTVAYSYSSPWFSYNGASTVANSHFAVGWSLGGGLEYALNDKWSVKGEYLHLDLGDYSSTYTPCSGCGSYTSHSHATDDIFRVGLNYRF